MRGERVIVVGAGISGLVAAWDLAASGCQVTILEQSDYPGGKIHQSLVNGLAIDAGPTVLTMRWIFDDLFHDHGQALEDCLELESLDVLARHAWSDEAYLDLFSDREQTADAIGKFAGPKEARGYLRLSARADEVFDTLDLNFMRHPKPSIGSLTASVGISQPSRLWNIRPFATLYRELGNYFSDPRLMQLYGRYATYSGSSPFLSPATLMLIAEAERRGVWRIKGGIQQLAMNLAEQVECAGGQIRYCTGVQEISVRQHRVNGVIDREGQYHAADAVVFCGDVGALRNGDLGTAVRVATPKPRGFERTLSAVTVAMVGKVDGFPLHHHNVFFGRDYRAEFDDIFKHDRLPRDPTIYICAQDRANGPSGENKHPERFLTITNAPANGDISTLPEREVDLCLERMFALFQRCGLTITANPTSRIVTTPADFNRMFPASGGALYGMAMHGSTAAFNRPTARSTIPGLYLAGGTTHPGPGMPMAATSGRMAAASLISDFASTRRSHRVAMPGGT
ncbi:MAG: 1-hydroxycarotenoid 3,4-desaturase CrtD [Pseudomonadota bacterium]